MAATISYVQELENLIVDKLLPTYEAYNRQNNIHSELTGINPRLIKEIKRKKLLPALLRPKEMCP
jgi:hypothetical protein